MLMGGNLSSSPGAPFLILCAQCYSCQMPSLPLTSALLGSPHWLQGEVKAQGIPLRRWSTPGIQKLIMPTRYTYSGLTASWKERPSCWPLPKMPTLHSIVCSSEKVNNKKRRFMGPYFLAKTARRLMCTHFSIVRPNFLAFALICCSFSPISLI